MTKKKTVNKQIRMNNKIDPPHFNPLYFKGYSKGFEDGKKAVINHLAKKFENLQQTKGFGEKTLIKIIEALDLPMMEDDKNEE